MCQTGLPVKPLTTSTPMQFGGLGRILDFFGAALAHPFGIAIAPQARRQNGFVAIVDDGVRHALADQVRADGVALQAVFGKNIFARPDVAVALQRLVDFKMIAPASQFKTVISKTFRFSGHIIQREVRPLTGEESYWPSHNFFLSFYAHL